MRTTRIILLCIFLSATVFVLVRFLSTSPSRNTSHRSTAESPRSFFGFVYYNTPFSLFPPNAAISLTDDNSTSFAARPAAFGPKLASTGLSGPLWVGSGFVEDSLLLKGNGEFGCGDVPGWEAGRTVLPTDVSTSDELGARSVAGRRLRADDMTNSAMDDSHFSATGIYSEDDGTDNNLDGGFSKTYKARQDGAADQADVKSSTQQPAEIQGKVVLLMRGGCGFLEKVMWAQRRGAVAVIVGDNQRGGPLIQMFARGDETENVTIPSVFTARTTAQLLSSLTQPGSFIDKAIDDSQPGSLVRRGLPLKKHHRQSGPSMDQAHEWLSRQTPGRQSDGWLSGLHLPRSRADVNGEDPEQPVEAELNTKNLQKAVSSEETASPSLWHKLFGDSSVENAIIGGEEDLDDHPAAPHEGLWVTIIPTSGASPFFDTLLVLVVSPLVTLTVVYSLLVLRARIRRRRWRAPKSVVDRLPVRTYHTVAISPSLSSRTPSPSRPTPTTPLLPRRESSERHQSQTTEQASFYAPSASIPAPPGPSRTRGREEHEKGASGFSAEWRKYMGRQIECVVCLEEYVDGVSRVMSLPCGHEFHADCM